MLKKISFFLLAGVFLIRAQYLLIPMDNSQQNHLKAYGVAYQVLKSNINVEWLLNYRGGSFLFTAAPSLSRCCNCAA